MNAAPTRGSADVVAAAARALGPLAERDVPLAPLTTYRVGGRADLFVRPRSLGDLAAVSSAVRATGVPVLVVGRGSNMLVADEGFRGLAVSVADIPASLVIEGFSVVAPAAVFLPVLARRTVAAGLTGFEWAVGVPGSVGGAVRMNAGGHGSDVAASLRSVHLFDLSTGQHGEVPTKSLGLRFRGSDVADHQIVLSARFELASGDVRASEAELAEIVRWRRENQPGGQNCGSVFVNPVPGKVSAGALIDRLGLRGLRHGTAAVSEKHANFIQASDGGTASDVVTLIEHVRERVLEATGYALRSEVRLVGFDDAGRDAIGGVAL